ncbi:toll/interleukin-1 receptor domain-containing protein [Dongia sp.]|uniref:toll/interleukin-1 receptor domain-containing protein n=1 Tax=Dongia sp. TaxID=1977262 RepID=UPI0035B4725B
MSRTPKELVYGPVYVTAGQLKGRILYYDDDERRTAICYAGQPTDFVGTYDIQLRYLREPTIDDLLKRREEIWRTLTDQAIHNAWHMGADEVHELWSEKDLISNELYERRMVGEMRQLSTEKSIFLCHSSADKGFVRMVNDDLRRLGASTWLDENNIKVGESIVGKISSGLKESQFLVLFLSESSVKSLWTRREWQSYLSRQLSGNMITILPVLIETCEIPEILADLKYANFSESYHDGLKELHAALV